MAKRIRKINKWHKNAGESGHLNLGENRVFIALKLMSLYQNSTNWAIHFSNKKPPRCISNFQSRTVDWSNFGHCPRQLWSRIVILLNKLAKMYVYHETTNSAYWSVGLKTPWYDWYLQNDFWNARLFRENKCLLTLNSIVAMNILHTTNVIWS